MRLGRDRVRLSWGRVRLSWGRVRLVRCGGRQRLAVRAMLVGHHAPQVVVPVPAAEQRRTVLERGCHTTGPTIVDDRHGSRIDPRKEIGMQDAGANRYGTGWHDEYDRTGSPLSHRLRLVRDELRRALASAVPGPIRLVSACAGQGRDVIGVLADHPRRTDVRARLVELDPENAARARADAGAAGLDGQIEVVEADAGLADPYVGAVPAEIVLMCGVFGNIPDADVRATVAALSQLCAPDAFVIWTRHRGEPDLTPTLRRWFAESGWRELAFTAPDEHRFSVGLHQLTTPPTPIVPGSRYFSFNR
ncbi:hypothetical protein ACI2K4_26260 [Micromonospora sp. NPDC050397]|uniref:hypothetical protein n=1 Tax=Micromonospora sp. NPDC050397 TaxID=3364279 RepID=UPI0038507516